MGTKGSREALSLFALGEINQWNVFPEEVWLRGRGKHVGVQDRPEADGAASAAAPQAGEANFSQPI